MKARTVLIATVLSLTVSSVHGQDTGQDPTNRKLFVGSTFFMLGNLARTNPPDLVQLNVGYRITSKDVISIEATTW